jgi:hypothetical protein
MHNGTGVSMGMRMGIDKQCGRQDAEKRTES